MSLNAKIQYEQVISAVKLSFTFKFVYKGTYIMIITSNYSIEQCFANQEDQDAIKRRFREAYIENANSLFLQTKINLKILNK